MTATAVGTACATWYCIKGSNDTYFRVALPAKAIGAKTCLIPIEEGGTQFFEPSVAPDREFRWFLTKDAEAIYPDHEGAAVFNRPDLVRGTHMLTMRSQGIRVVAEVDDNYLAPIKMNPYTAQHFGYDTAIKHVRALACADAIVFSTEWLRDTYIPALREETRQLPELHVCGNHIDPNDWPESVEREDKRLSIGWMGGPSHLIDLRIIKPACQWAAEQGHRVTIIGQQPEDWDFEYHLTPWVDPKDYERLPLPLDIALAPLRHDRFTLGKTDVKLLEYGMSGAAVVASNMPIYSGTVKHGETGFLAGSAREFTHFVKVLAENPGVRKDMAEALTDYVRRERNIYDHADEWKRAVIG